MADYLVAKVQDALAADPRVGELGIVARVAGGELHLTGTVTTAERRDLVAAVVQEVAPELTLHNGVSVCQLPEPEDAEQLA